MEERYYIDLEEGRGKEKEVKKSGDKGRELEYRNKSITLDKTLLTNIFFSDILRKTF